MSKKKQTVVKIDINGEECQQKSLSKVAKIKGIQSISVNNEKKTLTVVGNVEPVPIFKALKKIKKNPEIVTVGPAKPKCKYCQYLQNVCTCGMGSSHDYGYPPPFPGSVYGSYYQPQQPYSSSYYYPGTRQCELVGVGYPPYPDCESPGSCSIA